MSRINWGVFCRENVEKLLSERGDASVTVQEAIEYLEDQGWKHSLTEYKQKRKHLYEVFRQARRDGHTTLRVDDHLIVDGKQNMQSLEPRLSQTKKITSVEPGVNFGSLTVEILRRNGGTATVHQILGGYFEAGVKSARFEKKATIEKAQDQVRQMVKSQIEAGFPIEHEHGTSVYMLTSINSDGLELEPLYGTAEHEIGPFCMTRG